MPFSRIFFLLLLAALTLRAAPPAADPHPGGTLTLAQALALALEHNPELTAFSWEVRAAEARLLQAGLRPNPEISLMAEDVTGTGEFRHGEAAQRTLQLSQLVELGGKRAARVEEARAGRVLAGVDYQVRRVGVLRETTEAFVDVLVAQRQLALAEESLTLFESAVPLTEKRVEAGRASAAEVTRSRVSASLARIAREQARRDLLAARARLAAQWGETRAVRFSGVSGDLDRLRPLPEFSTLVARLSRHPQLARWTAEREKREAAWRRQRAQAVPDITVYGGPRVTGQADNVTTGVVGMSIPLPFSNRNQGNIAEASALLAKTEPEARAAQARAFAELSGAYQTLARAAEEAAVLQTTVLPGATKTVELLASGYEAGRFSQLEILDARRTLASARGQYLRALADYHKALAQVEALTAAPVELTRAPRTSSLAALPPAPSPLKPLAAVFHEETTFPDLRCPGPFRPRRLESAARQTTRAKGRA